MRQREVDAMVEFTRNQLMDRYDSWKKCGIKNPTFTIDKIGSSQKRVMQWSLHNFIAFSPTKT
jgi:hypothetical protein